MGRPQVREEISAGGVVVRCGPEGPKYLLILDGHHNWGFPKGHIETGEDPATAAQREIMEETGLTDLVTHAALGTIDWFFQHRGHRVHKSCHLFLFESREGNPVPQRDEGIRRCRWCHDTEALGRLTFENARDVLRRAVVEVARLCAAASVRA